ncbi:MAG: glycosyltransferase family 1 protein [Chloroflexi bacterium]|nr:glycosyltransferase family 1 protein [Chloroflexota bacterium]
MFKNKSVLFVGSESYDAATITVLQGLHHLGFSIYTLGKPNINSWFCNQVVTSSENIRVDFVLSNLHWGTRWGYYEKHGLLGHLKILIDGDDSHGVETWRDKLARHEKEYIWDPPDSVKNGVMQPFRWCEPLGRYAPDIVFTAQKLRGDRASVYLPFGIHDEYVQFYEGKTTRERDIDILYVPGPGVARRRTERLVRWLRRFRVLSGVVHTSEVRGEANAPSDIIEWVERDNGVHGYYRWVASRAYFSVLNRSKVLIYPGVMGGAWWDSKRPWEAYASGCLVLMARPGSDVDEYPLTELCEYAVYDSACELVAKCRDLRRDSSRLDRMRMVAHDMAMKYFTATPIARYVLQRIADKCYR